MHNAVYMYSEYDNPILVITHALFYFNKAILTQTPVSSHDVFSFQNTKRKTALVNAG